VHPRAALIGLVLLMTVGCSSHPTSNEQGVHDLAALETPAGFAVADQTSGPASAAAAITRTRGGYDVTIELLET
jgi:hypothetical protein